MKIYYGLLSQLEFICCVLLSFAGTDIDMHILHSYLVICKLLFNSSVIISFILVHSTRPCSDVKCKILIEDYSFRVTRQLGKKFCPSCGNSTLVKLSASVDENGVTHYQMPNTRKPFNIRGKKVSTCK